MTTMELPVAEAIAELSAVCLAIKPRSGGGLTRKHLDVLQVGASTGLQKNCAARVAARVLEGEGLALLKLEKRVGELGLGESNGSKGRDGGGGILHVE